MLPPRAFRIPLPIALVLLIATLQACGGAPVSAGQDGTEVGDAVAPSTDGSTSDGGNLIVVGDGATGPSADAAVTTDAATLVDAGVVADSSVATMVDAAPNDGVDAAPDAAADVSVADAPVADAPIIDAAIADEAVVEAGPVCTSAQLRCGGVCVPVDTNNCGTCGLQCTGPTPVCSAAGCTSGCATDEARCSNVCVDTATDSNDCGACGHTCSDGETCQASQCGCPAAQALCGSACTPTATDDANCGTCGHACGGGETCESGSCVCPTGRVFCGSACTNESTDDSNCGTCGRTCFGGQTCESGTCGCSPGQTLCGGTCTNVSTDGSNCGACGTSCTGGETCQSGTCACPAGETLCDATCVAESSDVNNCGACGHGCLGGACSGGMCQPVILTTPGGSVNDVATDGTYVYWGSSATTADPTNSVGKCEIANCAATITNLAPGLALGPGPMTFDPVAERVLFGTDQGLWYAETFAATAKSWAPSTSQTDAIWIGPLSVYYWATAEAVYFSNEGGTDFGTMFTGSPAGSCSPGVAVATDASHVYATDCSGRLLSCPIGSVCGSTPSVVATGIPSGDQLFFDGSTLWMTAAGTAANDFADGALYKCGSTSCSVFAAEQAYPVGVVSDGANVYWTDDWGNRVMRSPTANAAPVTIASVEGPTGMAQTGTAILWGTEQGSVYLLAK